MDGWADGQRVTRDQTMYSMFLKTKKTFVFATLFAGLLILQTGCLLSHSHHTVIRQDEPLRPMTFASESARNAYEACVDAECNSDANNSRGSLAIPFLIGLERSRTTSESAIRNDVSTKFDINGDDHISDYEAGLRR